MTDRPKVEPPAEIRQMATMQFQLFQAHVDAGFSESQALQILGVMISASLGGGES